MVENQEKQGVVDPPMAENQGWPTHIEHRVGCIWPTHPWQGSGWPRSPREPTSSDLFLWCYLGHTKPPHHHDTCHPKLIKSRLHKGWKWVTCITNHKVTHGSWLGPLGSWHGPLTKWEKTWGHVQLQRSSQRPQIGLPNPTWAEERVWPTHPEQEVGFGRSTLLATCFNCQTWETCGTVEKLATPNPSKPLNSLSKLRGRHHKRSFSLNTTSKPQGRSKFKHSKLKKKSGPVIAAASCPKVW